MASRNPPIADEGTVRPIPGWPGFSATSGGAIIGPHGRELSVHRDYPTVRVQQVGADRRTRKPVYVHTLVALAFHGAKPAGTDIDHLDGDRENSRPENLRYVPSKINRGRSPGVPHNSLKTHCVRGHPFDAENTHHARGRRYCKACSLARSQS